jgi:hypothetical protein
MDSVESMKSMKAVLLDKTRSSADYSGCYGKGKDY